MQIPCTVGILTRNSAETLSRALESVRAFSDIIVCDGGSSDATVEIARTAGARVVAQPAVALDQEGRIVDYAAARNAMLREAKEPWFFFLDADEYLTPELAEEIAQVTKGEPAAYWVPRYYTWGGERVVCSTTYPNRQVRLFHKSVAREFIRRVHERIELLPGAPVLALEQYMVVPQDTTPEALWRKWDRYIALGDPGRPLGVIECMRLTIRHVRPSVLFALRHVALLFCRGRKLPLWRELAEHYYSLKVIASLWRRLRV